MKTFNQNSTAYQNVWLNNPGLFAFSNSFFYENSFTGKGVTERFLDYCHIVATKGEVAVIRKFRCLNKFANSVFYKANDQYKIYAPEVIGRLSRIPAFGFIEFVAETYSYLNQSETFYGCRNRSSKYCFLFKYCSLSFLSFYF